MNSDDREYFCRRAREEARAAQNASCEAARERHAELAELHRHRCSKAAARHTLHIIVNAAAASLPAAHLERVEA